MGRLLAFVLIAVATLGDRDAFEARRSAVAEQEANARRTQIRAEIRALGTDDWAGDYYAGEGLAVNQSLTLAPSAGYVFEWHGCLGLYDRNYGALTAESCELRLSFTFENVREGLRGIDPVFTVVRWGERRYLVPSDDIVGFCSWVNMGWEPRTDMHGPYFLRRGDEAKPVSGAPEVPSEYREYLLPAPVDAIVSAVGERGLAPSSLNWRCRVFPLVVEAGAKQGLKVGMELVVIEPESFCQLVRITRVEGDRSEAVLPDFSFGNPAPRVGWRLSTRWRWIPSARE